MHALEFLGVSHARVMGLPLFGSRRKPGSVLLLADQSVRGVLCVEIVCTPIYDAASLERRTPTEPPRDARSGGALRRGWPPDTAKQPAFWYCTDLAFGYLRSDKFQSARPPDDKQSPKPSGRPPDGERPHELRGWISKTTGGQPYGATTKMAQSQDTDGRGGNKEFTPRGQDQGWDFHWDFAQPSQVVRGGTPWGGLPSQGFGFD